MGSTDKTTVNTDQIAAEAWDKAIALYTESGNRQEAINEVLSAIEKATKAPTGRTWQEEYDELDTLYRDLCKDYYKAKSAIEKAHEADKQTERERMNAVDERYRAAHASEHPHANWCQSLPPFNANCNCGAAHASETCETCGRPSIENGIATHLWDHSFKQPAHASEQPEADFVAAKHHPSCTLNDQDLMWVCAQCGLKVPAQQSADTKLLLSAARNTLERVGRIAHEGKIEAGTLIKIRAFALSMVEAIDAAMRNARRGESQTKEKE